MGRRGPPYLDYVQSYGASILGHAHPDVVEAIRRAAAGRHHLRRADRAARCCWPRRSAPGSPAATWCGWCRAAPRRPCRRSAWPGARPAGTAIVMFAGCYHGHSDGLLAGGGSGVATLGLPASAGVPAGGGGRHAGRALQRGARRRRRRGLRHRRAGRRQHGPGPARARASSSGCGRRATAAGALLIFDEVITGFRLAPGGAAVGLRGAARPVVLRQGHRRRPAAGRLRRAAGTSWRQLAPIGPVYQAGTLSGNPLATAAGLAVLGLLDDAAYQELAVHGRAAGRRRWPAVLADAGLAVQVPVVGPLVGMFFADRAGASTTTGRGRRPRPGGIPGSSTPCSTGASPSRPGAYEVLFPSPGPHRRRHRADGRGGRRGGRRHGGPAGRAGARLGRWAG